MNPERGKSLTRLWSIVEALRSARRGLTVARLVERTGGSRASIYRDLKILRGLGLPIDKLAIAGEVHHVLAAVSGMLTPALTPLQLAALVTGRRALSPLEGTRLVRELDALMRKAGPQPRTAAHVHVPLAHSAAPERVATIDRALEQSRCLRIRYRGAKDTEQSWRVVEPVELRVSTQQPYLVAYDRASQRFKTYKLARISHAQLLSTRARAVAQYEPNTEFRHSRGIWSESAREVAVRLHRQVARFAAEWPLQREQSVTDLPNGDVVVRARVAGLTEPLRWVLSWGRNAEALEPAELREMVAQELGAAHAQYDERAADKVSPRLRRG